MRTQLETVAVALAKDFAQRSDNSSVYEIEWELISLDHAQPVRWRYVGNASDARYGQLLHQNGYVQISTTRSDCISQLITNN